MECQLKKGKLNFYQMIADLSAVREETVDMIVPDMHPDILRIVESSGMAIMKGKELQDGRLDLSGQIKAVVLYVPESGKGVVRLETQIPFSNAFEQAEISPACYAVASMCPCFVDARVINPRKVYLHASIRLGAKIFMQTELEIATDVESSADMGIQMLKEENRLYVPISAKDKTFTLIDELEIPGTKPPAVEILKSEVILLPRDSRVVGNKVVFKGDAIVKTLYRTDGAAEGAEIYPVEHELPFSQIIEMEDLEEKCDCRFHLVLSGMEMFITGGTPDSRVFSLTLGIDAQAVAYVERQTDAIVDIYSTVYDLSADAKPCVFPRLADHMTKTQNTKDMIETAEQVSSILSVSVLTEPAVPQPEQSVLTSEADVSVLFTDGDGQLYSVSKRVPVSCPLEATAGAQYEAEAAFTGEAFAAASAGGIETRFATQFDCTALESRRVMAVYGVKVDTGSAKSASGAPSVVLRRTQPGDTLWTIAKRHNTTTDDLIVANGIEDAEETLAGRMLLIPRKRQ